MRGSEPDSHPLGRRVLLGPAGAKQARGVALLAVGVLALAGTADSAANGSSPRVRASGPAAVIGAAPTSPVANVAHMLDVRDEGHLHSVSSSGSELLEEGPVAGTIPGKLKVSFNLGATISAKFTIYAKGGGSISGHGGGALRSTGVYASFGGSLAVTGGSGRYAHAHGSGNLSGAVNRKTYALTVKAVGKLSY